MKSAGIYIHVPFCKAKCDYCNFYSIPVHDGYEFIKLKKKYLKALSSQIKNYRQLARDTIFDTVYLGGGTPPILSLNEIRFILDTLNDNYNISPDSEITIECNPDVVNRDLILEYKNAGVNRVTLGIQTLDNNAHLIIGRSGRLPETDVIKEIADINEIILAIDLICGIPGLSNKKFLGILKNILKYNIKHVSVYMLSIEKETKLYKRLNYSNKLEIFQKNQFEIIIEYLINAGFDHYEVSNFAKDGCYSRHNLKYWQYESYLGFGPGAHSFFNNERWFCPDNIYKYVNDKDNQITQDIRSINSTYAEFFMTGLRLKEGISDKNFYRIFNIEVPAEILNKLLYFKDKGLISLKKKNEQNIFSITRKGFFITDTIIYEIVKDFL